MASRIVCVAGSRPQLLKTSRLWADVIIDTGQHYDKEMVQGLKPDYNLKTSDLGQMIDKLLPVLVKEKPTHVVVIGDTRSTLAGATAACYLGIPVIHLEAGMRSYESMPEEYIRTTVDKMSSFHLVTHPDCKRNLEKEGIYQAIWVSDPEFDIMYDYMPLKGKAWKNPETKPYILLTLHRQQLLASKKALSGVLKAIGKSHEHVIFPCHPHTRKLINKYQIKVPSNIKLIKPVDHKTLIRLILHAEKIVTDSGGVQREAYWLMKDVIILRDKTEHYDIISQGSGVLVGHDPHKIKDAIQNFRGKMSPITPTGDAHERIKAACEDIASLLDAY